MVEPSELPPSARPPGVAAPPLGWTSFPTSAAATAAGSDVPMPAAPSSDPTPPGDAAAGHWLYPASEYDDDIEYDPTAELANWGPPLPPVPERPSLGSMLWPWGMRGLVETVEVLALALVMFMFVRSLGQNFVVDGGSMEPTFHNGEMVIVNKISYRSFDIAWLPWSDNHDWRPFGQPNLGDVVVFKFPQNPSRDFIKRIIGLPGQTVEVHEGRLYLDGQPRNEPFLAQPPLYEYGPAIVPDGQYFVLGDNRNNSYDSHSWGMLGQSFLIGRAELRYWPFARAGRVGDDAFSLASPQVGAPQSASTR